MERVKNCEFSTQHVSFMTATADGSVCACSHGIIYNGISLWSDCPPIYTCQALVLLIHYIPEAYTLCFNASKNTAENSLSPTKNTCIEYGGPFVPK